MEKKELGTKEFRIYIRKGFIKTEEFIKKLD